MSTRIENAPHNHGFTTMQSMRWLLVGVCTMVAAFGGVDYASAQNAPRPNILLIVADDLGYSDLGCFGGEIRTPNLDGIAERGIRLTQFYNTGRCCPSRASILTGQYPHSVGLGHMTSDLGQPGYRGKLAPNAVTIAQALSAAGYQSFLSGKWHLGTPDPTQHGFAEFYGTLISAKTFWDPDHFLRLPRGRPRPEYAQGEFYGTDALVDQGIEFLKLARQDPDRPWFLYLAFNSPHFPLHAPREDIERYVEQYQVGWDSVRANRLERMKELGVVPEATSLTPRSRYWDWGESDSEEIPAWDELPSDRRGDLVQRMAIYAAMVDRMDQNIGRMLTHLTDQEELENTLIFFTSDNGACAEWDAFGFDIRSSRNNMLHWDDQLALMGGPETFHSVGAGWANASNTPWRLFKHFNHEGGIASPGILSGPRNLVDLSNSPAGSICETPMHIIDIFPTLLDASSTKDTIEGRKLQPLPGRSMLQLLRPESDDQIGERLLFFEHQGNRAVRQARWKLVALRGGEWELYDMAADRTELQDLASQQPERVERLSQAWENWAAENNVLPIPNQYGVDYLPQQYRK